MPTITLKALFVFIVLEHRRRVLHFNVTDHPTAAWTSYQIVEAFAEHDTPRYLLQDRPRTREVLSAGRIVKIPHFGGLHHRYERIAD